MYRTGILFLFCLSGTAICYGQHFNSMVPIPKKEVKIDSGRVFPTDLPGDTLSFTGENYLHGDSAKVYNVFDAMREITVLRFIGSLPPAPLPKGRPNNISVEKCLPLASIKLNSPFGRRWHPIKRKYMFHTGVDLYARGDTVRAILPGKVTVSRKTPGLGNHVSIAHRKLQSIYGHLSVVFVLIGDRVEAGQAIGVSGNTGLSTGEHLHFSLKFKGKYIDPMMFIRSFGAKMPL